MQGAMMYLRPERNPNCKQNACSTFFQCKNNAGTSAAVSKREILRGSVDL